MNKNTIIMLLIATTLAIYGCSKEDTQTTINTNYQGNWEGTYTGNVDYGTWKYSVDASGKITGTGYSTKYSQSFTGTGTSDNTGKITFGSASTGSTFSGQVSGTGVSGTWANTSQGWTGTFTGTKK